MNRDELQIWIAKTLRSAIIAGSGVAVTFVLEAIARADWGSATVVVAGISSVLINGVREYVKIKQP